MFTKRFSFAIFVAGIVLVSRIALAAGPVSEPLPVLLNDNLRAAGTVVDGTLLLNLRAAEGLWRPEGEAGPALRVEAFGADGDALRVPAPLIRVREGTAVVLWVRNDLDQRLTVHGLCARDGQRYGRISSDGNCGST